jgi:hypothetical protein
MGILARVFFDYSGEMTRRWFARFPYTRTVLAAAALFAAGFGLGVALIVYYVRHQYALTIEAPLSSLAVTGLFFMIAGFNTFTFTLLLHSTSVAAWRR